MIAIMAAVLAVGGLGGGNATDDMIENNIKASDTWAFYQAKNVRQTMYRIEAEKLKTSLAAGIVPPAERPSPRPGSRIMKRPSPATTASPIRKRPLQGRRQEGAVARTAKGL